jgi:hypothetical protein
MSKHRAEAEDAQDMRDEAENMLGLLHDEVEKLTPARSSGNWGTAPRCGRSSGRCGSALTQGARSPFRALSRRW